VGDVATLQHEECVRLDAEALVALYRDLGPAGADAVLVRALREVTLRLEGLAEPHRIGQWAELSRRARALRAIAEQVGLDRPAGIRQAYQELAAGMGDTHAAEHEMMECLGRSLWEAQRAGQEPDEQAYLECVQKLAKDKGGRVE